MTLVPLKFNNFVKNSTKNTVKVKYKNSDLSTYVTDNTVDSKSVLNTNLYNDITPEEIGIEDDILNIAQITKIATFINRFNNLDPSALIGNDDVNYAESYFKLTDFPGDENNERGIKTRFSNDNLKLFNFRNFYGIERVRQKFLPQSFELQKKTYVKNNLYRDYNNNFSLDHYKNLEYGFCNWNTINFFSQRYDENVNHANCIVWPNTKNVDNNTHQYNFLNGNFNLSFYFNLRKKYSNLKPECVFHVPDIISIYFIRNDDDYKIAITLGDQAKFNLNEISDLNIDINSVQHSENGFYYSSDLNISNNTWYNLSLNLFKNEQSKRTISLYIDGDLKFDFSCDSINYDINTIQNSYICLGNKPVYRIDENDINYDYDFSYIFANEFDKDISLGKNNVWKAEGDELIANFDKEDIYFQEEVSEMSESFHGEIHDLRIYGNTIYDETKLLSNCKNTINNIQKEIDDYSLQFYVPVHYIPTYTNKKSSFNAHREKERLKYSCIYNPILSNTCGGLEVTVESYLVDFVNHTKPNVIIGAENINSNYIYQSNVSNSISAKINEEGDVEDIKKGEFVHHIYNKNFNNSDDAEKEGNNLTYRNLLILPNDNGIQKVRFDAITELLNGENYSQSKFDDTLFNSNKPFNVSVENIYNLNYYNKSRLSDIDDETTNDLNVPIDYSFSLPSPQSKSDPFKINKNDNKLFFLDEDLSFNVSNIIYHDTRITNISNAKTEFPNEEDPRFFTLYEKFEEKYQVTNSNPVTRVYKEDIEAKRIITNSHSQEDEFSFYLEYKNTNNKIEYLKFPLPYSVLNRDFDSMFINIFDISSKLYNKKIKKNRFTIKDNNLNTTNSNVSIELKDNGNGGLYRSNCLSKVADWNYVGHLFYKEGMVSLNRPDLYYFGELDFECEFESDFSLYVHEINIPADIGLLDTSANETYNEDLRQDESAFNSEESFVYITDINLHDENLNIVARAKLARPAPKKKSDSILFRLKMDY